MPAILKISQFPGSLSLVMRQKKHQRDLLTRSEVVHHVRVSKVRGTEEHLGQFFAIGKEEGGI